MEIESVKLRKVLDHSSEQAVEAEVNGKTAVSTGEIPEDIRLLEEKFAELEGMEFSQEQIDSKLGLEDTDVKGMKAASRAVSLAFKHASGFEYTEKFPVPMTEVVRGSDKGIGNFIVSDPEAESFQDAVETNISVFQQFREKNRRRIKGMDGKGRLIASMSDEKILRSLKNIADGEDGRIGVEISAEGFYDGERYDMDGLGVSNSSERHLKFVQKLIDDFELFYVEDPFHSEDFRYHAELASKNPEVMVSGNRLIDSKVDRLDEAVENGACNTAVLSIKGSGTVSEKRTVKEKAEKEGYASVLGSTNCITEISHSLELGVGFIKIGVAGVESRKLNRLCSLWESSGRPGLGH